jgi:threonine aldolase
VRALEERTAELLGKAAALFVPTGTMGNQIAIALLTRPGDDVIIGEGTHAESHESGAAAALSGVQFRRTGGSNLMTPESLAAAVRPAFYGMPRSRLVIVENTHNAAGGRVVTREATVALAARARALGLALHLDGARLWNASVATGEPPSSLAEPFDTVSVCFSKGLGAPVGSALAADRDLIEEALRIRKRLGGGMRQAGILAAGALHALDHHRDRLARDHDHARCIADRVSQARHVLVDPREVETNIVNIRLARPVATRVMLLARERGVWLHATAPEQLRAVTHLDVSEGDAETAAAVLVAAIAEALSEIGA